jgi:hypothetical protein
MWLVLSLHTVVISITDPFVGTFEILKYSLVALSAKVLVWLREIGRIIRQLSVTSGNHLITTDAASVDLQAVVSSSCRERTKRKRDTVPENITIYRRNMWSLWEWTTNTRGHSHSEKWGETASTSTTYGKETKKYYPVFPLGPSSAHGAV